MQEGRQSSGKPPDDSATDTDSDGERIRSRKSERVSKAHAQKMGSAQKLHQNAAGPSQRLKRKTTSGKTRSMGISLQHLVEKGLLQPGKDVLTVEYKSQCIKGDLREDGTIVYEHSGSLHTYESPSAFSIAVKRQINPSRKADDGWKTVKFQGKFLEYYKKKLQAGGPMKTENPGQPAKKAKVNGTTIAPDSLPKSPNETLNGNQGPIQRVQIVGRNLEDVSVLVPCKQFSADLADSADHAQSRQPFGVHLSSSAAMLMDLHSHLSDNEVIGILTGRWDSEAQAMRIERAYPVHERNSRSDTGMVQMDESSENAILDMLSARNLKRVGWYHSHPHAPADPSPADIAYQIHQQQSEGSGHGALPQFAVIVSPYKGARDRGQAGMTCFQAKADEEPASTPAGEASWHAIEFKVIEVPSISNDPFLDDLQQYLLEDTVKQSFATSRCADLSTHWKEDLSKSQKLVQSVTSRLPVDWDSARTKAFVQRVEDSLASAEALFPKVKREEEPEISQSTASESGNEQQQGLASIPKLENGLNEGHDKLKSVTDGIVVDAIGKNSEALQEEAAGQKSLDSKLLNSLNGKNSRADLDGTDETGAGSTGGSGGDVTQELSGLDGKHFFDSEHNLVGLQDLPEIDSLSRLDDLPHW